MYGIQPKPRARTHCENPDRDCPRLKCGYPLPCPWHTAIIDETVRPSTVTIPVTAKAAQCASRRLNEIARVLEDGKEKA